MDPLMDALTEALDSLDLHYQLCTDPMGAAFGVVARNGHLDVRVALNPKAETCIVLSRLPFFIPPERRPNVAELITRLNFQLAVGCFELDYADGELRFRSSVDFEGEHLTPNMIRNLLRPTIVVPDEYLAAVSAVAFADVSPVAALSRDRTADSVEHLVAQSVYTGLSINPLDRLN